MNLVWLDLVGDSEYDPGGTQVRFCSPGVRVQTQCRSVRRADRKCSATRPCGSRGIGGGDVYMTLCQSASRCETCPAKGEPARAGSKPGADPSDGLGEA